MPSTRKPFNDRAGYVSSLKSANPNRSGWVVIYEAEPAGIDTGTRYAVTCEKHGEIVAETSMPRARASMKTPEQFCQGCRDAVDFGRSSLLSGRYLETPA